MARTEVFRALRRAFAQADASRRTGRAPDQLAELARRGPSRRQFLGGALGAAALLPLATSCGDNLDGSGPKVAIIGGGIAGLHCAYRLQEAGLVATVYEASMRTGGRMFTARGMFADDQVAELGGELIDSGHVTLRMLAAELGLALDDLAADATAHQLRPDTFFFDGALISEAALVSAFTPVAARMSMTVAATDADAAEFDRIDNLDLSRYLADEVGLPATALIRRILELAYVGEYGLETAQQSAFNLLDLIDHDAPDPFRIFGDSDERSHTHLGNQAIVDGLAAALPDRLELDHSLTAVAARGDGRFTVTFTTGGGTVEVVADHVVFALPFTRLRTVDLTKAGVPADKQQIIDELGYGTNAKLMLGLSRPVWRTDHQAAGGTFTDVGQLQAGWDSSRGQAGVAGIFTNFVGGQRGLDVGAGTAADRAAEVVPWLEQVYSGAQAAYTAGSALRMHWPTQPQVLGSYACYRPGQAGWSGREGTRVGKLHFCGEHTSVEAQGYMEGGAETGARVADEIIGDHGRRRSPILAAMRSRPRRRRRAR